MPTKNLLEMLIKTVVPAYQSKRCSTRGCGELAGHDGRHSGRAASHWMDNFHTVTFTGHAKRRPNTVHRNLARQQPSKRTRTPNPKRPAWN